jgi:uncharacterized protein
LNVADNTPDAHSSLYIASTATSIVEGYAFRPLKDFVSARASVSFEWAERYDQAGLLLSFKERSDDKNASTLPSKWIKTGIEFYNGKPMLATVACDTWADWSLAPLPLDDGASGADVWTTISIEKEGDEHGVSLWVYHVKDDGEKVPLREITWVYGHDPDAWFLQILAMAARPEKRAKQDLEVAVKDMSVNWAS